MQGLLMKYFVLKPKSEYNGDPYAKASRRAMRAYAKEIMKTNPTLSAELIEWVDSEESLERISFKDTKKPSNTADSILYCDCGRELSPGKCFICDNDD